MKKTIAPILLATVWISLSEFVRNQFLLQDNWSSHYADMGLTFPSAPANGAVWGIWSLLYACVIFFIARHYSLMATILLSWLIGFGMMWLVLGNLLVLPYSILPIAIPLSILEAAIAAWIIKTWKKRTEPQF